MKVQKSIIVLTTELRAYFASQGLSNSNSIATETKINQSQIYRNLFDTPKRVSKTIRKLCDYANIDIYEEVDPPHPRESDTLMCTLSSVWNGTEEHARQIAKLLKSVDRAGIW